MFGVRDDFCFFPFPLGLHQLGVFVVLFLKRLRLFVFWRRENLFLLLVASEHAAVMVELQVGLEAGSTRRTSSDCRHRVPCPRVVFLRAV